MTEKQKIARLRALRNKLQRVRLVRLPQQRPQRLDRNVVRLDKTHWALLNVFIHNVRAYLHETHSEYETPQRRRLVKTMRELNL